MIHTKVGYRLSFADIISAVIVFIIAVLMLIFFKFQTTGGGEYVQIQYPSAKQVYSIYENKEIKINSNGYTLTVIIENGNVYVKDADCQDKICVGTGKISDSSRPIVCLPAKVIITITGKGTVDYVVG